jgi:transcriptional regulator with XRE-family HTH domain
MSMTSLSERLKELRGSRSLYAVEQATKIDRSHLKRYEAGLLTPTLEKLKTLGDYYDAMEELLFLYFDEFFPGKVERAYLVKWLKHLKQ